MKIYSCPLHKDGLISKEYANRRKSTPKRFAIILIVVSVIVIAFGGYIFRSNQTIEDTKDKLLRLQIINNGILKADKVATENFTRILLSDGRYGVPISSGTGAFSQLFSELATYDQVDELNPFIEQIKTADENISRLESGIDTLYIEKNLSEARAIFSGDEYAYWKGEYSNSTEQIIRITYNDLNTLLKNQHDQTNFAIAMLFILLPISLLSYILIKKFSSEHIQLINKLIAIREQFELAV